MSEYFAMSCSNGNIDKVREIMSRLDFKSSWITSKNSFHNMYQESGLYYACVMGHFEIVKLLLEHVDIIPIVCLIAILLPIEKDKDNYLKIIKLLFKHGKFDREIPKWLFLVTENSYFNNQLKTLFDEYTFRIDGPKYNENII